MIVIANQLYILVSTMHHQQEQQQEQLQEGQQISDSDPQFIKTTKAGRKDLCKCCRNALSKYTCPRCSFRTCSLACTRRHKQLQDCKGYLDPTQKVKKRQISEKTVKKDYEFVGEMISGTDKIRKCLTGILNPSQQPKRFFFLKKQAKGEYNIKIHQAPSIIERHRENISFYYMKTQQIFWVIDLLYFKGDKKYTRHILQPTADSKTIQQIIPDDFLCTELLTKGINTQKKQEFNTFIEDRVGGKAKDQDQIIQVPQIQTLRNSLKNKNVYQFPTIILVHKNLVAQFKTWKNLKKQQQLQQ